jgi:hypothetical protein
MALSIPGEDRKLNASVYSGGVSKRAQLRMESMASETANQSCFSENRTAPRASRNIQVYVETYSYKFLRDSDKIINFLFRQKGDIIKVNHRPWLASHRNQIIFIEGMEKLYNNETATKSSYTIGNNKLVRALKGNTMNEVFYEYPSELTFEDINDGTTLLEQDLNILYNDEALIIINQQEEVRAIINSEVQVQQPSFEWMTNFLIMIAKTQSNFAYKRIFMMSKRSQEFMASWRTENRTLYANQMQFFSNLRNF